MFTPSEVLKEALFVSVVICASTLVAERMQNRITASLVLMYFSFIAELQSAGYA
jgi:hypothetical protein